jgi:hypothetical protein
MSTKTHYVVWNPNGRLPTFRHATAIEAIREAERLAQQHMGLEFIVLKAIGSAIVEKPVVFKEFAPPESPMADEIPF